MASWRAAVFVMIILAIALLVGLLPFYAVSRANPGVRLREATVSIGRLPSAGKPAYSLPIRQKQCVLSPLPARRSGCDPYGAHGARGPAGPPPPSVPRTR